MNNNDSLINNINFNYEVSIAIISIINKVCEYQYNKIMKLMGTLCLQHMELIFFMFLHNLFLHFLVFILYVTQANVKIVHNNLYKIFHGDVG